MTRWEYRQVIAPVEDFEVLLNEQGSEGWEVVFVTLLETTSPVQLIAILKRQHPAGEPEPRREMTLY
jgi:hypothetical protein